MTDPGTLNQRLTLEVPVEAADGAGGVTRSYEAGPTLWASLTPLGARADIVAASLGARVTHRVVMRMRSDVTTRHRLRKGARMFRIVALREQDASGRFLVIDAEERRD
jgi:SPP1 family predicted phage head-tail adaptor